MITTHIPTIGPEEDFYGYITGVSIETGGVQPDGSVPIRLFATFEYNDAITVWIVPDYELFAILADHLCGMALHRHAGSHGVSKLWIARRGGHWIVDLP